jgi:Holliday junction DNA helicase RuvA
VGKKLAQRILLELKDKLAGTLESPSGGVSSGAVVMPVAGSAKDDAIAALVQLGYSRSDAMNALQGVEAGDKSTDELIRAALKRLF